MKTYKLYIREYNIVKNDYVVREETVETNDIYHEIGKIYCQSIVKIKRIDYQEISPLQTRWNSLREYIIKQKKINNGAIIFGLSSDSEREKMKFENNLFDDILDKINELEGDNNENNWTN